MVRSWYHGISPRMFFVRPRLTEGNGVAFPTLCQLISFFPPYLIIVEFKLNAYMQWQHCVCEAPVGLFCTWHTNRHVKKYVVNSEVKHFKSTLTVRELSGLYPSSPIRYHLIMVQNNFFWRYHLCMFKYM